MADKNKAASLDFEAGSSRERLPVRAWLRIFSTSNLIENEIRSRLQAKFGVSLAKYDFLAQLERHSKGAMTMGELGDCLMVTGGSVTGLTDRLEADGLVVRVANPNDRRSHMIEITDKGSETFAEMAKVHDVWLHELFAGLEADSLPALMDQLDIVKTQVHHAIDTHQANIKKDS